MLSTLALQKKNTQPVPTRAQVKPTVLVFNKRRSSSMRKVSHLAAAAAAAACERKLRIASVESRKPLAGDRVFIAT